MTDPKNDLESRVSDLEKRVRKLEFNVNFQLVILLVASVAVRYQWSNVKDAISIIMTYLN